MALQGSLAIIPVIASKTDRRFSEDITHSGLPVPSISVFPGDYRITMPVKSLSLFTPGRARRVPLGTRGRPDRTESVSGLPGWLTLVQGACPSPGQPIFPGAGDRRRFC